MTFSVVVPTYNRVEKLKICLSSLREQDFPKEEYEVIVVDDGSTDGTEEFIVSLNRQWPSLIRLRQENKGPAAARNLGVGQARGEYIAFTDDDCLVDHDWLGKLKDGFRDFPKAGGVGGYIEAPKDVLRKNVIAKLEYFETHHIYKAGASAYFGGFESPTGGTNNISYLKRVIEEVGMFDESFPVPAGEDADLKLRIVRAGYKIGYLPIKATHLDSYSVSSFLRRSVVRGFGSAFFERKHGRGPDFRAVAEGFIFSPLVFVKVLKDCRRLDLSFLMMIKSLLMSLGRLKFLYTEGKK